MNRHWGVWALALAGCFWGASLAAGEFAVPPSATKTDRGARIDFAVKAPIDVEVSILDVDGKVVRHLAAGLLGPNAPSPLQKDALAQSLLWDGRDDAGRMVEGSWRVRARLGMQPRLDGFIGDNPQTVESVRGLTTDRQGRVYVLHVIPSIHGGDGTTVCHVFDRDGRYVRAIMPYPADLADEKLAGLRRLDLGDGRRAPFIFQGETRSLYPGVGEIPRQRPVVARDGRLAFVGIEEYGRYAQPGTNRVTIVHTDGGVPREGLFGPKLGEKIASGASLALSPDEKWLYATGLYDGYAGTFWEQAKWHHVVYRAGWDDAEAEPFLGTLHTPGKNPKHLNDPRSVAVDPQGRLYVADRGNDRIAVFDAEGKYLYEIAVEQPSWVEVHPASGALYVLAGGPLNQLIKFSGGEKARELARIELPNEINGGRRHLWPVMTLEASADPPVVFAGAPAHYCRFSLLRIEDRGDRFGEPVELAALGDGGPSVGTVTDVSLDRRAGRLYVRSLGPTRHGLFDASTGKLLDLAPPTMSGSGPIACFGADGNFYVYEGYPDAFIRRYGPDMQPLPFAEDRDRIEGLGSPRVHGRGMCIDAEGTIYVLCQEPKERLREGDARDANVLRVYGADGRLRHERLVDSSIRQINSVRVDSAGNIYLAAGLRAGEAPLPENLPAEQFGSLGTWRYAVPALQMNWYPLMYGSIVRFPPQGGRLLHEDMLPEAAGLEAVYAYDNRLRVVGASWVRGGVSNLPSWRTAGSPDVCLCVSTRFDVDPFGRVFFPDAARFRVGVLDAAGNVVGHFGEYGNRDSAGPGSLVPKPEIAFAWPQVVAADAERVFVADQINRRIVRLRLAWKAEALSP
jgi:hypothetical protein